MHLILVALCLAFCPSSLSGDLHSVLTQQRHSAPFPGWQSGTLLLVGQGLQGEKALSPKAAGPQQRLNVQLDLHMLLVGQRLGIPRLLGSQL